VAHRSGSKTVLSKEFAAGFLQSFCRALNFCGFKWSNFVAVCTDYFDTQIYWVNLKDFHGYAAEYTLISCNVSSERTPLLPLL
jgi:hypothetical protein